MLSLPEKRQDMRPSRDCHYNVTKSTSTKRTENRRCCPDRQWAPSDSVDFLVRQGVDGLLRHAADRCDNGHRETRTPYSWLMSERERLSVYNDLKVVDQFDGALGWTDHGEQTAVLSVAPLVRGGRLLDIGVGAGRTVSLLSLLSDSYVGIDYAIEMVSACHERYPKADIRWGDARDLSAFPDRSFDFVLFSFNGIDTLDQEGRATALMEIYRVLDEGGLFVFSTHNKDGQSYGEKPFQLRRPGQPWDGSARAAARFLWRNVTDPLRFARRYLNWSKAKPRAIEGDGWGISPLFHLDFALLNSFVTLEGLRRELQTAKFEVIEVFNSGNSDIQPIPSETKRTNSDWLHVVAKKGPS
jgi:SAM-dependent methyltransferase